MLSRVRALVLCLTVLMALCLVPAHAFTVEYLASNASIHLEFAEANFPHPPTMICGRSVVEWLDAAGPANPSNVWQWQGAVQGYEPGWYTALYPYASGSYITASTQYSASGVAFAGGADQDDGRGQFYVDNTLVAQIDFYDSAPVHYVLLVDSLSQSAHTLQLTSLGPQGRSGCSGAVALYGGAALQPIPEPSTILALLFGLGGLVWRRRK